MVSNLTGRAVEPDTVLDASYWRRQAREPVAFRACIETLAELGVDAVVEIGPHSVLGPMTLLAWPESAEGGGPPAAVSSLRQPHPDVPATETEGAFVAAVAQAYEAGLPIRFEGLFAGESRRRISLPGYPFQRERHWVEAPKRRRAAAGHPLLGDRHESASGEVTFETEVFPSDPAWLDDHRVFGRLVAPGALYGAMAVSASPAERASTSLALEDMQLHNPLVFPEEGSGDEGEEGAEGSGTEDPGAARRCRRRTGTPCPGPQPGGGRRGMDRPRGSADSLDPGHPLAGGSAARGPGGPEGRSRAGGRAGLLPRQGRGRNRPRPVVPHPGAGLVAAGRSAGRGVLPAGDWGRTGSTSTRSCSTAASRSWGRRGCRPGPRTAPPISRSAGSACGSRTACRTGSSATCACGRTRGASRRTTRAAGRRRSWPAICASTTRTAPSSAS